MSEEKEQPKKKKKQRVEAPEVVVPVRLCDMTVDSPHGYIVRSDYSDGILGHFILSRFAMQKIRQMLKQILVLRLEGATITTEIPGVRFIPELSATLVPGSMQDAEYQTCIGWLSVAVDANTVLLTAHAEDGAAEVSWNITKRLQKELDEVHANYSAERTKRLAWFGRYKAAGRTPLTNRPGAPRGRKPKNKEQ